MNKDFQIIKSIKNRDEKGMHLLIDKYGSLVKSVIYKHSYGYDSFHDECFNDCLLAVWENIDQFDEEKGSFKNWLCAIARYKALNLVRKNKKAMSNSEFEEDKVINTEDNVQKNFEIQEDIEDFLSCLSKEDRDIFLYLFYKGLTVGEVSEIYNLSQDTIYKRISRGRSKMKEKRRQENEG